MMELITPQRRRLADVLDGLSPAQWQAPTLCAGWTAGHVLAHLTMPFRISEGEFMAGMAEAGGDFTAYSDAIAERDSGLPQAELAGLLRDNADNPWAPPGGGLAGALSHDLIHGLDVTWPQDANSWADPAALTAVLGMVANGGEQRSVFGFSLAGLRLEASDLDWTAGTGEPLAGPGRDLLLLIAGRRLPRDRFTGPGAQRLPAAA